MSVTVLGLVAADFDARVSQLEELENRTDLAAFCHRCALIWEAVCCSEVPTSATMQRPCALLCLAAAVGAFQPPAAKSQQLTQMYGFDNPASRPKYDYSVQFSNGTAAWTVTRMNFRHSALPRRRRGRSQVEQGRLQAGARVPRRRHALDDPAEGPFAGHGLREDGRLLRRPRRRRRCGAGLPGLGFGCRQSSGLRVAPL